MRSFKTSINWKLSGLLTVGSWITGFLVLPFTFSLVALPPEIPLAAVIAAQMVQLAVLLSVSCYTGLRMAKTAGLPGAPVLEGILKRERPALAVKEAVFWGLAGGALTVVLCIPFWDMSMELMKQEMAVAAWKGALACFYGGVAEEVLFRLFMMTFFVWLLQKCSLGNAAPWLGILVTGIIFGLGHIGITSEMTAITAPVVLRAVLLNGSLSVIYGILYWKRGLESAMIAHFSTDVVLHILIPHIIAPFFV